MMQATRALPARCHLQNSPRPADNNDIADYEIVSLLGVGGMGRVYRVRNVISQRTEAMKVLLADLKAEPDLGREGKADLTGGMRQLA